MKIVGSSKQDGIPSPDNPVEIKNETILIITDKEGNKKEMPFKYEKILKEDDKIEKINEKWYLVRRKHMNEEEIELINGFFNKGWCCDLDEVYNVVMKLQDLYNKEIQRNKDLEQILELTSKSLDNISYDQMPIAIEELLNLYNKEKEKNKNAIDFINERKKTVNKDMAEGTRLQVGTFMWQVDDLLEILEE